MTSLCMAIRELSLEMEHRMLLLQSLGLHTNGLMSLDLDPMQREVHKAVFSFLFPYIKIDYLDELCIL